MLMMLYMQESSIAKLLLLAFIERLLLFDYFLINHFCSTWNKSDLYKM